MPMGRPSSLAQLYAMIEVHMANSFHCSAAH
jgi:hypothetical protein